MEKTQILINIKNWDKQLDEIGKWKMDKNGTMRAVEIHRNMVNLKHYLDKENITDPEIREPFLAVANKLMRQAFGIDFANQKEEA